MRNIRKGNDIIHHWSILAKSGDTSVPYDLMGKNLTLLLAIGARETRVMDFSISANVLTFPYYGKDQDRTGNVTLTLIENEGLLDMHTLDKVDAYRLVAHSNEVGGEDTCSHLNMEVVNLASTLEGEIGPRGYSAYEIAVQNGFVGTEEEWLASLKGEQGEPGTTDYNELENKPDLSQFITKTVNNLTNYYLKSETYTKSEVLALIAAIQQFHFEVYPSLSDITSPAGNVLYLIGPTGSGSDKYEEYVYSNGQFVKIGDTTIDLSGYVTTQQLNTALALKQDKATVFDLNGNRQYVRFRTTGGVYRIVCMDDENNAFAECHVCQLGYSVIFQDTYYPDTIIYIDGDFFYVKSERAERICITPILGDLVGAVIVNALPAYATVLDDLSAFPFLKGQGENSSEQRNTGAVATGDNSVAENNAASFPYHTGQADEREIVPDEPTTASGLAAHAEGIGTEASGQGAHSEGSIAITDDSHWSETGEQTLIKTEASGRGAHAEGLGTKSKGSGTHSEGIGTIVGGNSGHGEGYYNEIVDGEGAHTEGMNSKSQGNAAHSEGYKTYSKGTAAHSEGRGGNSLGYGSHTEGGYTKQSAAELELVFDDDEEGESLYTVVSGTPIVGTACNGKYITQIYIVEGENTPPSVRIKLNDFLYDGHDGDNKKYIFSNRASGASAHSEGDVTLSLADAAHSEGVHTLASGKGAHAEGIRMPIIRTLFETFEDSIKAAKNESTLYQTLTDVTSAEIYKEGDRLQWLSKESSIQGPPSEYPEDWEYVYNENIRVTAVYSGNSKWFKLSQKLEIGGYGVRYAIFVRSEKTISEYPDVGAKGEGSHIEGISTEANNPGEHAEGRYNFSNSNTIHSIGIGTAHDKRKNAFEVTDDGRVFIYGVGGYDGTNSDAHGVLSLQEIINGIVTINNNA